MSETLRPSPIYIKMHESDDVAIVANDGGLPSGTVSATGLMLCDKVPQDHKVALVDILEGGAIQRYNVTIGYALKYLRAGSWVHERLLKMPAARELTGLPKATIKAKAETPLEGYTFEGYRNADGSVGSCNILAITQTVQCVAGVTDLDKERVDRRANTTPGNKKGGLSNIVEKAMGSIVKSGSAAISGVMAPGKKVWQKALIYATTPASELIRGTLQLAAGINLHVFSTGRGTPYGLAELPVIKVATRSDLARRRHDLMDINAGTIVEGQKSIEEVGWELFQLILDVASGRKKTWAEHWKLRNALVLFNPAPVT